MKKNKSARFKKHESHCNCNHNREQHRAKKIGLMRSPKKTRLMLSLAPSEREGGGKSKMPSRNRGFLFMQERTFKRISQQRWGKRY
jgi:hypothetical protein